jgi:flagellar hook-associated protein 2
LSVVDGLVSGMDTTTLIKQLIDASRAPVTRLTSRQTQATSAAGALGTLRTLVTSVRTAADGLDSVADWQISSASSSDTSIATAAATSGTATGSLSFTVDRLAAAHALLSNGSSHAAGDTWATGNVVVNVDGSDHTITVVPDEVSGVRDLDSVVSAVNAADLGLRAQAIQVAPGEYRLSITAQATGVGSEFAVVSGMSVAFDVAEQAQDARIVLAGGTLDAVSPTNTFEDLLPGVDVTVKKVSADSVTVQAAANPDALATKVQTLVSAVNTALTNVRSVTAYDSTTKKASILTGDSATRRVSQDLTSSLMDGVAASPLGSPALAGITLNKDGTLSFDRGKFLAAYADDPEAVRDLFTNTDDASPGVAQRLLRAADAATQTGTGYLRTSEQARRDRAAEIAKQITKIEDRLGREAESLRKRFAGMEAALGNLQSQSSWLAGQIASLGGGS